MNGVVKQWQETKGMEFLAGIGIRNSHIVLDFGCGTGHYTIPAARLVGEHGRVYALDKDNGKLQEMMTAAQDSGLTNITPLHKQGFDLSAELKNGSVDAILLYDVLHFFEQQERNRLYSESSRILRPEALLSVFPKHSVEDTDPHGSLAELTVDDIIREIESTDFSLDKKIFKTALHNVHLEKACILRFRKMRAAENKRE